MSSARAGLTGFVQRIIGLMSLVPYWFVAFLGRFSIAAVFWKSGQTKVEGFSLDLVSGTFHFGIPHLSDTAVFLFKDEYKLPFIPPEVAAPLAAIAEHVFPALLLVGLASRFSALGLLVMTAVIEIFVYPAAYPTHGTWAAVLLMIIVYGPGKLSLDHFIASKEKTPKG